MPEIAARDPRYYTCKGLKSRQYYARDDLKKSQKIVNTKRSKGCDYHVQEDLAKSLDIMAKYGSKNCGYNH